MIEANLKLQKNLEDYVEYLENISLRSTDLIIPYMHDECVFTDPILTVHGAVRVSELFRTRIDLHQKARIKVRDFCWGRREQTACIVYDFTYEVSVKRKEERKTLEVMSEMIFASDGKIMSFSEKWGAVGAFQVKAYEKSMTPPSQRR